MAFLRINCALKELFLNHGIEAEIQEDTLIFPGKKVKITSEVFMDQKSEDYFVAQLDILVYLPQIPEPITESFAGFGNTQEETLRSIFENFIYNSFHVILAAFFDVKDDQVTQEVWKFAGEDRNVIMGGIGVRGRFPSNSKVNDWFFALEEKIQALRLAKGLHWMRIFYSQMNNELMSMEALSR